MNLGQLIEISEAGEAHLVSPCLPRSVLALEALRGPVYVPPPSKNLPPCHRNPLGRGAARDKANSNLARRMERELKDLAGRKIGFLELSKRIDCSNSKHNRSVLWALVSAGRIRARGARYKRLYWAEQGE